MDIFGSTDPALMPPHFFWGATHVALVTAIRANIDNQNYTVAPRHWYVDAEFDCESCGESFVFSASEQQAWYEEYRFYVDSIPRKCKNCRRAVRHIKNLRREYDEQIGHVLEGDNEDAKKALVGTIDAIEECSTKLERRMQDNRARLLRQLS